MIDIITILLVIKCGALIFEDVVSAARGKPSPRKQARERREAAERAAGRQPRRVSSAAGRYIADLFDDANQRVRDNRPERWERRRERQAQRRARRHARAGHGPVLVDFDRHAGHWYGTCDDCGWTSRPHRVKGLADEQARRHADSHTDPDYQPGQAPVPDTPPAQPEPTQQPAPTGEERRPDRKPTEPNPDHDPTPPPDDQQLPDQPAAPQPTPDGGNVNTEVAGPESIRSAFAQGADWAEESATNAGSSAAQLEESAEAAQAAASTFEQAAENYETAKMAASTVEQVREAAQHATAAAASYQAAAESARAAEASLQAANEAFGSATADFNARDGAVADAAEDAGNLADREVLEN